MTATFVCDRDGIIRFASVSGDITERAEPAVISLLVETLATPRPERTNRAPGE